MFMYKAFTNTFMSALVSVNDEVKDPLTRVTDAEIRDLRCEETF